jgi:hypothetical protein
MAQKKTLSDWFNDAKTNTIDWMNTMRGRPSARLMLENAEKNGYFDAFEAEAYFLRNSEDSKDTAKYSALIAGFIFLMPIPVPTLIVTLPTVIFGIIRHGQIKKDPEGDAKRQAEKLERLVEKRKAKKITF